MPKYHELFVNFSEDILILIGSITMLPLRSGLYLDYFCFFIFFINLMSQLNSCFKCALPTLKLHKGVVVVYLAALQCVFVMRMP